MAALGPLYLVVAGLAFGRGVGRRAPGRRRGGARTRRRDRPSHGRRVVGAFHRLWPAVLVLVVILGSPDVAARARTVGLVVAGVAAGMIVARVPLSWPRPWLALLAAGLLVALLVPIVGGGVGWDDWGGLQLTCSAPSSGSCWRSRSGVLLALGRRSTLPAIRVVTVGYIELFRGVPLVTLLFIGGFVLGFLFPTRSTRRAARAGDDRDHPFLGRLHRRDRPRRPAGGAPRPGRGGPGAGPVAVKMTRRVVLPQALRAVIPAMVGQFISLFKDTSLLSILGFFELVEVAERVTQQPDFRGQGLGR